MNDYDYVVVTVMNPNSYSHLGYDTLKEADAEAHQTSLLTGMAWVRHVGAVMPEVIYIDGWPYKMVKKEETE